MKTYTVSVNIRTASLGLSELSELLEVKPSCYSQERGSRIRAPPRFLDGRFLRGKKFLKYTCWRLKSKATQTSGLRSHLNSVFTRFPLEKVKRRALLPPDAKITFDIGVCL